MSPYLIFWILLFLISLLCLVKGADLFSDFAERLAIHFKIPPFIIGVTIVSFGTSLPELFYAVSAVLQGAPEIALGDVIGSNITNIFLVLGLATVVMKTQIMKVTHELIHVDLPFFVGSAFLIVLALWDGEFTRGEAIIALCGAIIYILYTVKTRKKMVEKEITEEIRREHPKAKFTSIALIKGLVGLPLLFVGARFLIESITNISIGLDIGVELIAITLVPLGSNLPEIGVTVRNAIRGKSEIVIGNILGSNIFNLFGVLAVAGLFGTLTASAEFFALMLPVLVLATLLYYFITQEKQITRWEGGLLLLFYIIYVNLAVNTLG